VKNEAYSASIRAVIDDPDIDVLRIEIDSIDRKLLQLLAERLAVVHKVGDHKREKGLKVFDPAREEALLKKLIGLAPSGFDEASVRSIFSAVVAECRRLETEQM